MTGQILWSEQITGGGGGVYTRIAAATPVDIIE